MRRYWRRPGDVDLEAELRTHRPVPRLEFLRGLAGHVRAEHRPVRAAAPRVAFAATLTAAILVASASVGALGNAASAAKQVVRVVQRAVALSGPSSPVRILGLSSGGDQYRPGFAYGDPNHNHPGPPRLRRAAGPGAPPLRAHLSRDGTCALVITRVLVDEQADLRISVQAADGTRLLLTQNRSSVGGGSVSGPRTKTIRYRVLIPRVIRLTLCIPPALLKKGERYTIVMVATDPSGKTSRLAILLTR